MQRITGFIRQTQKEYLIATDITTCQRFREKSTPTILPRLISSLHVSDQETDRRADTTSTCQHGVLIILSVKPFIYPTTYVALSGLTLCF